MHSFNPKKPHTPPRGATTDDRSKTTTSLNRKVGASLAGSALAATALLSGIPAASADATTQSSKPYKLVLVSLDCIETEDMGADHAYIKVDGKKVWGPVRMDIGDSELVNAKSTYFSSTTKISVYDRDNDWWDKKDDLIAHRSVSYRTVGNEETLEFKGPNDSRYELTYMVVRNR